MRDKDQKMIFSKADLALLKSTFVDNEELLYLIRKVMFQYDLNDEEKKKLKAQISPEVFKVIKKRFQLEITDDLPLGQSLDLLFTLRDELRTKDPSEIEPCLEAKRLEIKYLNQQLNILEDPESQLEGDIHLNELGKIRLQDSYGSWVDITARLFIISCVETNLLALQSAAGTREETEEERSTRMTRNSSK